MRKANNRSNNNTLTGILKCPETAPERTFYNKSSNRSSSRSKRTNGDSDDSKVSRTDSDDPISSSDSSSVEGVIES